MNDTQTEQHPADNGPADPGLGPVEIAAQRGIGPLSALANAVWHGEARPCPSCGAVIQRSAGRCDACGQDLSADMLRRMRAHSGPWHVLDHIRPFPGVTFERIVRQVRRGVLTRVTIVRGPTTDHQWRFAAETPQLSKYLGCCWSCQAAVAEPDVQCPSCGTLLDFDPLSRAFAMARMGQRPAANAARPLNRAPALSNLVTAVAGWSDGPSVEPDEAPPRKRTSWAGWLVGAMVVTMVAVLVWFVQQREAVTSGGAPNFVEQMSSGPQTNCARWGKDITYVEELRSAYRRIRGAGVPKEEVLSSARDACIERVSDASELEECRACVTDIVEAIFLERGTAQNP